MTTARVFRLLFAMLVAGSGAAAGEVLVNREDGVIGSADRLTDDAKRLPMPGAAGAQARPPKYLEIDGFARCLEEQSQGMYRTWCMPATRAEGCPAVSWKRLRALTGREAPPRCVASGSR